MRPILQPLQPTHAHRPTAVARRAPRVRMLFVATIVVAAGVFATFAAAPSPAPATPLAAKQAQARRLDAQVSKLERRYDELQERYRGALIELERIRADVAEAHQEVVQTRHDLRIAKRRLTTRAVTIYTTGGADDQLVSYALDGSISEFFDRLETVQRVSDQDADVLGRIETLNAKVERQEQVLRRAQAKASKVVARAERDKARMGRLRDQRRAALNSVNGEIRAIMEAQRRAAERRAAIAARDTAALADTSESPSGGGSGSGVSIPLPPGSSSAAAAANYAMSKLGSPYVWAAAGPDSFDCSGLVVWAFGQAGRSMPHSSYSLAGMGVDVPLDQLQVGDLVFPAGDGHVGIYVGGGSFVHAPHTGDVVRVTSMSDYSMSHARRV